MKPEFLQKEYYAKLKEEYVPSYPILQVTALDPDITDPTRYRVHHTRLLKVVYCIPGTVYCIPGKVYCIPGYLR